MSKQKLEEYRDLIVNNRFALHNHVTLTDLEENSAEGYLDVEDDVTNAYGMVHGGAFYALADVIAGMTARGNGHAYVTQTADLHYLSSTEERRIYGKEPRAAAQPTDGCRLRQRVTDGGGKCLFLRPSRFLRGRPCRCEERGGRACRLITGEEN